MKNEKIELTAQLQKYIVPLRRKINIDENMREFDTFIKQNIKKICKHVNTRWLVSICDTYADHGGPIEARNAMIVSILANMEKLAQTHFEMYNCRINDEKIKRLSTSPPYDLWDGMTTFNLAIGDLTQNMFSRIDRLLKETPEIHIIFRTILKRIKKNKTILNRLNKYHKNIFKY